MNQTNRTRGYRHKPVGDRLGPDTARSETSKNKQKGGQSTKKETTEKKGRWVTHRVRTRTNRQDSMGVRLIN